jgi:hypothetical protein
MPAESSSTTGDSGADTSGGPLLDVGVVPSYGEWWCVREEGAASEDDEPIVYEDDETPPEGCQCVAYNTQVHAWILDHEMNDQVTIEQTALEAELGVSNPLVDDLLELRTDIYEDAMQECTDLAPPLMANNCLDPTLFDLNPATPELEPRAIYRGNRDDEVECVPDPEGIAPDCGFVSLGPNISLVSGVYKVPKAIFYGFVDAPACLMHQGWRIGLVSTAFQLKGVHVNDILYRMGLRTAEQLADMRDAYRGDPEMLRMLAEQRWYTFHVWDPLAQKPVFRFGGSSPDHAPLDSVDGDELRWRVACWFRARVG